MDKIDALEAFVEVANAGNFNKAADKLRLSNQLVSKYVSQLEDHLGVRLFNRTTRKVRLTEAGEQCYQHAVYVLEGMRDMEGHLGQMQEHAQGLLRITAPTSFATLHLSSLISDFKKAHPSVSIDLQLNDRKVDVLDEGFDVALRIGHLKSSSLIAKQVAPVRLVVCASPNYLKKHGEPTHPGDLIPEHHLRYSYMEYADTSSPLIVSLKASHKNQSGNMLSNNGEILTAAAIAGEGYVLQPTFIVGDALKKSQLKIILPEYEPPPMALYAVYPHRKLLATKLRVFIDFISTFFGETPYWDEFENSDSLGFTDRTLKK